MKVLQKLILLIAITVGFSLTAMAQKQDDKKTPPKENRPTIPVVPKNDDKKDKPKDDKKDNDRKKEPRKPELAFINELGEVEIV